MTLLSGLEPQVREPLTLLGQLRELQPVLRKALLLQLPVLD